MSTEHLGGAVGTTTPRRRVSNPNNTAGPYGSPASNANATYIPRGDTIARASSPTAVDTSGEAAYAGITPTAGPKKPQGDAFGGVVLSRNKRPFMSSAFQAALSLGLRGNA